MEIKLEEIEEYEGNNLESRYYRFTEENIKYLCNYENQASLYYLQFFATKKAELTGLFYEISNVRGNWRFKDNVLPGLFGEVSNILLDIQNKLKEFFGDDIKTTFREAINYDDFNPSRRRFNSFNYLTEQFDKLLVNFGAKKLSDEYTHRYLEKNVKKIDIRIIKLLREYQDYFLDRCGQYAKKGLKRIVIAKCEYLGLPTIYTVEEMISKFYGHGKITDLLSICFKPDCSNTEHHIGLEPIWSDYPGSGFYAFYFDYYTDWKEKENLVLITENRVSTYTNGNGFPGILSDKPKIIDLFEQCKKKDIFIEWFNSSEVKKRIMRHMAFGIIYRLLEKKEIEEKEFENTTERLKDSLELIENYYGVTYAFDEVKETIIKEELEFLEKVNLIEEEKKRRREAITKLFPVIKKEELTLES